MLVVLYARPAEANYPGKPGKITCSGHDENDYEIYTNKVGGGGKLNVTDNDSTSDDYYPDYAPGGKRIAYTNFVTGGDEEIYTIEPDGRQAPGHRHFLQRVSVKMTHVALCTCAISMRDLLDWPE